MSIDEGWLVCATLFWLSNVDFDRDTIVPLNFDYALLNLVSPVLVWSGNLLVLIQSLHVKLAALWLDVLLSIHHRFWIKVLVDIILLSLALFIHYPCQSTFTVNIQRLKLFDCVTSNNFSSFFHILHGTCLISRCVWTATHF